MGHDMFLFLKDADFADDAAVSSYTWQDLKEQTNTLNGISQKPER